MAFNYAGLEATADNLITQFGRSTTYRQQGNTVPDSDRPWEVTVGDTDQTTVVAVFLDFTDREREDSVVEANDSRILVAAKNLTATPTAGDMIVDGAEIYTAVNVVEIKPGGTAIVYDLQVRK